MSANNNLNSYKNYDSLINSSVNIDKQAIKKTVDSLFDKIKASKSNKKTEAKTKIKIETKIERETETKLSNLLSADKKGNINEEQLQSAIVQYLLEKKGAKKGSKLGKAYLQELTKSIAGGKPLEDAVKVALKALVDKGLISEAQAEEINGISFNAAQLDSNLNALYDSTRSTDDSSIAVMEIEKAVSKAMTSINEVNSADEVPSRSLDAISNSVSVNTSSSSSNYGNGFLWKPVSESNGNLVVLFPPNLTGNISSAGIYSSLPPSYENLIEEGDFSGDNHNGGRAHFRFSKPGGGYPDGVYVVAQLSNGESATFEIENSSNSCLLYTSPSPRDRG